MDDLRKIVENFECSLDEDMTAQELQDALTVFFQEMYEEFRRTDGITRTMADILS